MHQRPEENHAPRPEASLEQRLCHLAAGEQGFSLRRVSRVTRRHRVSAPRRNDVRLLLLMDVGGTMDPYYEPVSQLLTALHEERGLRDFQAYYFHNTIYDHLYTRARMQRADELPTADVLRRLDERWKVVIVGDAAASKLLTREYRKPWKLS